jgi:DNA-binding GntR family transcriptional regulator
MATRAPSPRRKKDHHEPESAADRVHAFVKDQIITGAYPGGTMISEGEVSEAVQISRTPVREAFVRLAAEGLLRLYPKRGALVVPVSTGEIQDVLDARLLIERNAADLVIRAGEHPDVAAALRAVLEQHRANPSEDARRFTELDRQFHITLVEAAGNKLLTDFYATLRDRQLRMGSAALRHSPDRSATILAEHAALADLIEAGDIEAVSEKLAEHLASTRKAAARGL